MLLVIAILVLIIGIVWYRYAEWSIAAMATITGGAMAFVIMIFVIAINYISADASVAEMKTQYEMLTYQYENDFYENDNDVGKYQLVADIRSWNEGLSKNKKLQHNFWIGVFVPNIYDEFEYINIRK